jgi:Ca-activated chloride channel family protein
MFRAISLIAFLGLICVLPGFSEEPAKSGIDTEVTQGALRVEQEDGTIVECPLKHTDVKADISGFIARVRVTQTFHNPFLDKIEAVYVFPLPHRSAVDEMTMVIGERRIVGIIKRREEARRIYEQALAQGQTASLLEQERPNIFTQSVGNIQPGQEVKIEISYVDVLDYDMGVYEFHYPMVVGPRYNAGAAFPGTTGGPNPDPKTIIGEGPTTLPHGVNPAYLKPGFRTGHDISLEVRLDSGVPPQDIQIPTHQAEVQRIGGREVVVTLLPSDTIPNKDFVMKYGVVGEKPEMAILAHKQPDDDGWFMLMIQPKLDEELKKAPPRELVFLIDVSGSMSGEPTAKVKETMKRFFELTRSEDRLQVITFAGQANKLFPAPVPVTEENVQKAMNFTEAVQAGGGTEMLQGVKMVLNEPPDPERVRICIMLTDGYIGNEAEIIAEVGKCAGDRIRFWTLGIGSSPNRFLLDGVAQQGGGMSKVIGLTDDPELLVREIVERIHRAQLAAISIDWGELEVYETYPARIPELWAGRPVVVFGRYTGGGRYTIQVSGQAEGVPVSYPLRVRFPREESAHDVLPQVWARRKIEQLMDQTYFADAPEVIEEITQIALEYRLMSQFTSFVAVDDSQAISPEEAAKPPRRISIPVPLPQGVEFEGIFGSVEKDGIVQGVRDVNYSLSLDDFPKKPATARRMGRQEAFGAFRTDAYFAKQMPARGGMALSRAKGVTAAGLPMPYSPAAGTVSMGQVRSLVPTSAATSAPLGMGMAGGVTLGYPVASEEASRMPAERWYADDFFAMTSGEDQKEQQERRQKELEEARTLEKEGKGDRALSRFQAVYLLSLYSSDGQALGEAAEAIERLEEKRVEALVKQLPQLKTRLDRVVRNESLAKVLNQLGADAGIRISLAQGAESDILDLLNRSELRIDYLDLRGVSLDEALSWALDPFCLTWVVKDGGVEATTARRLPGPWPWVYEVSLLAMPAKGELPEDPAKAQESLSKSMSEFLEMVRSAMGIGKESKELQWLGAGQLLLDGTGGAHARLAALLEALKDKQADPAKFCASKSAEDLKRLSALQARTAPRWAERKDQREKQRLALERAEAAETLNGAAWMLLADALKGKVDLETLTRLEIALKGPHASALLEDAKSHVSVRALWALTEAAHALPEEKELRGLAQETLARFAPELKAAVLRLKDNQEHFESHAAALYATLALQGGAREKWVEFPEQTEAVALLKRERSGLIGRDLRLLGTILLDASPSPEMARALEDRLDGEPLNGEDLTVLGALAAKRCGAQTWKRFREAAGDLLGGQPLPGSVVVLIDRLASRDLPLVAMAGK